MGRKASTKNPPFLSHEFVIQNHADIVSCVAMVFVVGLMLQATNSLASIFIALHHNVTGADPSHENPQGEPYFYTSGWKDGCAVFFYTLICIIMHAILQEYVLDVSVFSCNNCCTSQSSNTRHSFTENLKKAAPV